MDKLPISVIIPTKNAERTREECLDSVVSNNPAEIIIVDGVSTDRTLDIARRYTEGIYSDEGKGPSYAHQLGTERATQEYISYVDADIVLPQGTLATMLAELNDYINIQARILPASCSSYWERAAAQHIPLIQARLGGGLSAALLRRDTVLKYKFDTFIKPAGDDMDFYFKLKRAGYKFGTSSACIYHHHRADLKGFIKQRFGFGRGTARLIWKYGPFNPEFWTPLNTFYWLAYCLIKGKPSLIPYFVLNGIVASAGIVKGFFEVMGEALRRRQKGG
jgi:glycosyltransferase involved in cell wall biosynthesis